jgi:hypothetical protein
MTELLLNERKTQKGLLVSVCDADVLGDHFDNGDVSLTVDADFYDGDAVDDETAAESLARCSVANIVGTRAVALAIDHGFVDEENVLEFEGTRHAQLLWL